jgi:eukaryotic-like serine/threonine-protein kinase
VSAADRLAAALADRYRLGRELGAGGMATVYLAHDLKHDRDVAIKVLKPELAAVLGAERFVTEIKTTAALQHPNILPLFDSGEAGGFLFYVMPYVEGETLRAKLDRETQLGVDESVKLVTEVADALQYAHEHGVVHRDIKPENILVHADRPMVADFGIALAVSAAAGGRMTETGLSLGTPHYMSPEQATAEKTITNRSDIYSLGAVLYEMLTGEPPHTGTSAQQIIMKIVTEDVAPVTRIRKAVPANVAAAVGEALEKLPADRFESAKAFADALANPAFRHGAAESMGGTGTRRRGRDPVFLAVAAVAVLAVGAALWGWLRAAPVSPPSRQEILLGGSGTYPVAVARGAAIAPDGSAIAYMDVGRGLWLKEWTELRPRRLADFYDWPGPSFSPDGRSIAFAGHDYHLERVSRSGGPPIVLSDSAVCCSTAWLDNGTIVSIGHPSVKIYATPAAGGPTKTVLVADAARPGFLQVSAVPGINAVLVAVDGTNPRVIALDLSTGKTHDVQRGAVKAWVADGMLLYVQRDGTLDAARFDMRHLTVAGSPVTVLDSIQEGSWAAHEIADAALGADGTLLYVHAGGGHDASPQLTWVARDGSGRAADTSLAGDLEPLGGLDLSPDGRQAAVALVDTATGRVDVYVVDLRRRTQMRLTFDGTVNHNPVWSPGGRRIMYVSDAGGSKTARLWVKNADGTGQARLLASDSAGVVGGLWSPDGKWIAYTTGASPAARSDLMAFRTSGDTTPVRLLASATGSEPAISPDGRWLAYTSGNSGSQLYVRPFPNTSAAVYQVSQNGGFFPRWSHDGRTLYYVIDSGTEHAIVAATVSTTPAFHVDSQTTLFRSGAYVLNAGGYDGYAVGPGDRGFLMLTAGGTGTNPNARLVEMRHWLPAVRAKLHRGGQ